MADASQAIGTWDFAYYPEAQAREYHADEQRIMQWSPTSSCPTVSFTVKAVQEDGQWKVDDFTVDEK